MEYDLLDEDERDEMLVEFMRAQQRDHYLHEINLQRYEELLVSMPPDNPFRERVARLRDETLSRKDEVERIIAATKPQMPPAVRRQAALARIRQREKTARQQEEAARTRAVQ